MTIVPEHRPSFYVSCDGCGLKANTIVGPRSSALEEARKQWGFVVVDADPEQHLCGSCAKKVKIK